MPLNSGKLLQIYFLGPFILKTKNGIYSCADWKSKKSLTIFKYLAIRQGEKVNKDVLIELLWPDSHEDKTHNLHTTIYYMRKFLKSILNLEEDISLIKHSKGLYWFEDSKYCWIDSIEFEKYCKKGKKSEKQNCEQALNYCRSALSLYRGEFLPDEIYEDWTLELRQYYLELYIEMTLNLAKLEVELNHNYDRAIYICQQAMEFDPFREQLYQQIMNYQIQDSRFVEVAKTYKKYKKMLAEEFGLAPSPRIEKLYQKLKDKEDSSINLIEVNIKQGAFICNLHLFKILCELQIRQQERHCAPFILMKISINNRKRGKDDDYVLQLLSSALRHGDVICSLDKKNILIQLFLVKEEAVAIIERRIKAIFSDLSWDVSLKYSIFESSDDKIGLKEIIG